jgi:hypothetical protein
MSSESVRPIPPRNHAWVPQVGSHCEFLFAEGWWTVLVQKALGSKWQVVYEPHAAVHHAPRENLRQISTWDGAGSFHPTGK